MADKLNYSLREFDGIKVVELQGNLTVNTNRLFESIIDKITEKESAIINMEQVRMITAAGLNTLVDVSQLARKRERRIVLLWANEELKDLSEDLSVYNLLTFAESLEEGSTKIRFYT